MSVYSIKNLEHLSGIKAHTIRIWEQRYNIFSPERTETNIRFYSEEDLKLILNISTLKNHGVKISKIIDMSPTEMSKEVRRLSFGSETYEDQINALTVAMIDLDEVYFNQIVDINSENIGFGRCMEEIIYPFLKKIGILWITNAINPAQEHFISHLVRQKLIVATDKFGLENSGPLFILFLPDGELHELSLLYANFKLRYRNARTIFFGQSVPLSAIEEVYQEKDPDYLLTVMTTTPKLSEVQGYVDALGSKFEKSKVLITGSQVVGNDIATSGNTSILNQFSDLDTILDEVEMSLN